MAMSDILKDIANWIVANFGKQILVVLLDKLQSQWNRLFAAKNILILGPKQTGKSSLLQYLSSGKPFEVVDGEIRPPAPTALAAIVDRKFPLQQGSWLKLKKDVPGDLDLRDAWSQAIADIKPQGIIYMVDGSHDDARLLADVREIEPYVLVHYGDSLGHLAALHVFVNFSDRWANNPKEQNRRVRLVQDALADLVDGRSLWASLRTNAAASQLSPSKKSWENVDRALHHFGADLLG